MRREDAAHPQDPVAAAASELYGLPPGKFTAARNDRAKQARADGAAGAATAIRKLAKPSVVAWLANQLVRSHGGEVQELLDVGAAMRHATAALDAGQLRTLSSRRQQLVRSLVRRARELASVHGQTLTDATARDLESTLHAALADEQAACQLSGGQLTAGLSYTGFPGVGPGAPPAPRAPAARPEQVARPDAAQAMAQAAQAVAQARADAQAAARAREAAQLARTEAARAARDIADTIRKLRSELDAALAEQADAGRAERQAAKDVQLADRAARQADRRLAELNARIDAP